MSYILAVAVQFNGSLKPPQHDRKYRRFICSQRCAVCNSWKDIEAAHTGPRGLAQKSDDRQCIPLCAKHHQRDTYSLHKLGPVAFSEMHGLDIPARVEKLNRFYDEKIVRRRKP